MQVVEPALADIPSGWFRMGREDGRSNERPVHEVWVDAFAMARTPVTNREFSAFVESAGADPPKGWAEERFSRENQPAAGVTWFQAEAYCRWLSERTGKPYALPSEAQREKAARGGLEGKLYPWGDGPPDWMDPRGKGHTLDRLDDVAQDPPNAYGLHNMGDLVHEWCADWYAADYYALSPDRNPVGPERGVRRSSRGGSWRHQVKTSTCASRTCLPPDKTHLDYGFRVMLRR